MSDIELIKAILEQIDSSSELDEENNTDYEDHVDEDEENTDTEQECGSEESEVADAQKAESHSKHFFIGKDKTTKLNKIFPKSSVKTRSKNIIKKFPGVKGVALGKQQPGEIWDLFFTEKVKNIIVDATNQHIENVGRNNFDRNITDALEMKAFLGLLLFAGTRKSSRLNLKDLFINDVSSPEIFRLTMTLNRFTFLLSCIRFDEKNTRDARSSFDKLAPIRDVFDEVVSSFGKYFIPSEYLTVDEKLEDFRGRCGFRQYVPSKPNKYGIKIYALCDAKLFYTFNLEVYVGKQPVGPYHVDTSSLALVTRLSEVIRDSWRNITCDNFFTSIPLAKTLLEKYNLTLIGTIHKNKRELPPEFLCAKGRKVQSSLFGYQPNCTLVSHVPKRGKIVLLISTMHDNDKIDCNTGKPEIITDYNMTKGGVDTVDKMCETYNCARGTNRWPLVIFYGLMNVSAINSFVIYVFNNPQAKTCRRKFLEDLSYDLIKPHIIRRASLPHTAIRTKERIQEICGLPAMPACSESRTGRCVYCGANMKSTVTFILVLFCTVVLAAKQSQAKKGCNAYGMACYGGHGKRAIMDNNNNALVNGGAAMLGAEPDALQNDLGVHENNSDEIEPYPPYRLIRIIKSWFAAHPRRFQVERMSEFDYPALAEAAAALNRDRTYN